MQSVLNVGQPVNQNIPIAKQKDGKSYTVGFKAGEVDQFVRGGSSRPQMTQDEAMMQMIKQRQAEQKKAKRRQKWMTALQVTGVISGIALAAFFIWQGLSGRNGMGKNQNELKTIWEDISKADTIDDMALPDGLKTIMSKLKKNSTDGQVIKDRGGKPIKSILLYGPPGTGKTTFAKAIAKMFPDSRFASLDVTSLGSEFQSVTERNLNAAVDMICKEAKENPTKKIFVFIDEIDSVMMVDKGTGAKNSNDVLNEFKKCFTEKLAKCDNIITIGATNLPIDVEKAVTAGGKQLDKPMLDRFAQKILVDLPTVEQVQNAVAKHYKGCRLVDDLLKEPDKLKEFAEHLTKGKDVSFRTLNFLYDDAAALLEGNTEKVTLKELAKAVVDKNAELQLPEQSLNWFKRIAGIA